MKTSYLLLFLSGVVAALVFLFILGFDENKKQRNATEDESSNIKWSVPKVPSQMTFAGEKVPLDRWEIKEQLDREFTIIYKFLGFRAPPCPYPANII